MKHTLIALSIALVWGCSKPASPDLTGSWVSDKGPRSMGLSLGKDHRFFLAMDAGQVAGTYDVEADQIVLHPNGAPDMPVGLKVISSTEIELAMGAFGSAPLRFDRRGPAFSPQAGGPPPAVPPKADSTACMSNLKQLSIGLMIYLSDNDDVLPPASKWNDRLMPYLKNLNLFTCPPVKREGKEGGYALNSDIAEKKVSLFPEPAKVPLFMETARLGLGVSHGPAEELKVSRHEEKINTAFLDAHVKARLRG